MPEGTEKRLAGGLWETMPCRESGEGEGGNSNSRDPNGI